MSIDEALRNIVTSDSAGSYMEAMIGENENLNHNQRSFLRNYADQKVHSISAMANLLDGATTDEAQYDLGVFWMENHTEWIRHNNLMNFSLVINGAADPVVQIQGSFVSNIVGNVETLLSEEHLEKLKTSMFLDYEYSPLAA